MDQQSNEIEANIQFFLIRKGIEQMFNEGMGDTLGPWSEISKMQKEYIHEQLVNHLRRVLTDSPESEFSNEAIRKIRESHEDIKRAIKDMDENQTL